MNLLVWHPRVTYDNWLTPRSLYLSKRSQCLSVTVTTLSFDPVDCVSGPRIGETIRRKTDCVRLYGSRPVSGLRSRAVWWGGTGTSQATVYPTGDGRPTRVSGGPRPTTVPTSTCGGSHRREAGVWGDSWHSVPFPCNQSSGTVDDFGESLLPFLLPYEVKGRQTKGIFIDRRRARIGWGNTL